jgi:hypothetical protein
MTLLAGQMATALGDQHPLARRFPGPGAWERAKLAASTG